MTRQRNPGDNAPAADIDWQELAGQINAWGRSLGFSAVGFTSSGLEAHQDRLDTWLANDYHGEMDYMARHGDMRSRPDKLHPGTESVICVRMDYLEHSPDPETLLTKDSAAYVSRYALGRDYHKVIRGRLKKLVTEIENYLQKRGYVDFNARVFTDSAPILEKAAAENAGLGWIGKNTLLLNEKAGSWFFLGEVLTNLPLPESGRNQVNRCGSCTACLDICPTNAFIGPYELEARRCISYLTIEHRGSIAVELREPMGNRVFGCDDCQLTCPWNRYAAHNTEADFRPRHGLEDSTLLELFLWDENTFLNRTEGSAIRRTGYLGWIRNLSIGIGNGQAALEGAAAVLESRKGLSDLTDEHIEWALEQRVNV